MKEIERLRIKVEQIIKKGGTDSSFLNYLFSNIRVVLEKQSKKSQYPVLSMFCNWYLHSEITRSAIGYNLIKQVGDLIFDDIQDTSNDQERYDRLVLHISKSLDLNALWRELDRFFKNNGISSELISKDNWERLYKVIVHDLEERPIKLPRVSGKRSKLNNTQKKARDVYAYLEKRAKEVLDDHWEMVMPISFSIISEEGKYFWCIEMKSMINLRGPLIKSDIIS